MTNEKSVRVNPTQTLDVSFSAYVEKRKAVTGAHLVNGIPDYAYGVDYALMRKINAVPGAYKLLRAITSQFVPEQKQMCNLSHLKVGPSQSPKNIYEHVKECAKLFGIGIPEVFIEPNPTEINAYALACDDSAPLIVLTSALVERFTPGEIKTVIGHECGHIHNNHGIYTTAAYIAANKIVSAISGVKELMMLVSRSLLLALNTWSRASEVTADRAGLICADNFNDAITTQCKFLYGAAFTQDDINVDAVLKQYDRLRSTPAKMFEFVYNHPVPMRRILAMREFINSDVLYTWRPDCKEAGMGQLSSKQELDARCEKYIAVMKTGERRDNK